MRFPLQPAFVLHHRPYRETSLIVDLLTQEEGRIAVVAKGIRTARSQTRALLQAFVPLVVSWQGKSELMTLCSVEAQGTPFRLQGDCILAALYLNELLMRLLHKNDAYPKLYTIYQDTLIKLQQKKLEEKTSRIFEKKLLEELGYGLQLQYDIDSGAPIMAEQHYYFEIVKGFRLCQPKTKQARIFAGKNLLALSNEALEGRESLRDAKRLMRLALSPLLGQKPLNSRQLFTEIDIK